jgi:hypothetical protein
MLNLTYIEEGWNITEKNQIKWRKRVIEYYTEISFAASIDGDVNENDLSPLQHFKSYFSNEFFEQAAYQTNLYAAQSNVERYKLVTADELQKYFGILILMGVLKFPTVQLYWDTNLGIEAINALMTCSRFCMFLNCMFFNYVI